MEQIWIRKCRFKTVKKYVATYMYIIMVAITEGST